LIAGAASTDYPELKERSRGVYRRSALGSIAERNSLGEEAQMRTWSLATRVFVGAWSVLVVIYLFKLWAAVTGNYTVNWPVELGMFSPLIVTSAGFLAARANRSAK
jgi:hypothetical protein